MSVAELGLRSRTTIMSALPQTRLEPLASHYEASYHFLESELDLKSARLRLLLWSAGPAATEAVANPTEHPLLLLLERLELLER